MVSQRNPCIWYSRHSGVRGTPCSKQVNWEKADVLKGGTPPALPHLSPKTLTVSLLFLVGRSEDSLLRNWWAKEKTPTKSDMPTPAPPGSPQSAEPYSTAQGFRWFPRALPLNMKGQAGITPCKDSCGSNYRDQDKQKRKSLEETKTLGSGRKLQPKILRETKCCIRKTRTECCV